MFNFSKCNSLDGYFSHNNTNTTINTNNDNDDTNTNTTKTSSSRGIESFTSWLYDLSQEERSKALNDLHGVTEKIQEDPATLKEHFAKMDHLLSVLLLVSNNNNNNNAASTNNNNDTANNNNNNDSASSSSINFENITNNTQNTDIAAYQIALNQSSSSSSPDYIVNEKLRFLRAENYCPDKAVSRMIRYMGFQRELFGEQTLGRDITMKDLNSIEIDALEAGLVQLLPQRDQAGRAVILLHGKTHSMYESNESVTRVFFYLTSAVLRDEETQLRGIVLIYYGLGQQKAYAGRSQAFAKVLLTVPWKITAIQYCKDNLILEPALRIASKLLEHTVVCRCRIQIGSPLEVSYNLMTYGITKEALPFNDDGTMNLVQHQRILDTLQYIEEKERKEQQQRQQQQQLQLQQIQIQNNKIPDNNGTNVEISTHHDSNSIPNTTTITTTTTTTTTTANAVDQENEPTNLPKNHNNTISKQTQDTTTTTQNDENNHPEEEGTEHSASPPIEKDNDDNDDESYNDNNQDENNNDDENASTNSNSTNSTTNTNSKTKIILVPLPMDVLLGRGRHVRNRPGSLRLHLLLDKYLDDYQAASKFKKMNVARIVLKEMKEAGCRFLTTTTTAAEGGNCEYYVESTEEEALNKISHGFRNLRLRGSCVSRAEEKAQKKMKKKQQEQEQQQEQQQGHDVKTKTIKKKRILPEEE